MRRRYITLILLISVVFTTAVLFADSYKSANYILSDAKILVSKGKANSTNYLMTDVEIGNTFVGKAQSQNYTLEADPIILARKAPNPPTLNPVTTPTNVTPQILSGAKDPYTSIWINGYQKVPLDNKTTWSCDITLAEGDNYLSITAKNIYGLESSSVIITITLDTTPPPAPTVNPLPTYFINSTNPITLSGTKSTDAVAVIITSSSGTVGPITYSSNTTWSCTISNLTEGHMTVTIKAKDLADNESAPRYIGIIIDTQAPTGTISINNDAQYTKSTAVTLNLSANDTTTTVTHMCFSNDNITYTSPESYSTTKSWTLTSGDGTKTVYVKYKDRAENWSNPASDTIILDTTPPPAPTITPVTTPIRINSQTITGTKSTDTTQVIITCSTATVGTVTYPTATTWACTLSNLTEGNNIINIKAQDAATNETSALPTTITYDKTAPTGTIKINNDSQYTKSTAVTLNLSANDTTTTVTQMQFSNDNITYTNPESYSTTKPWTLTFGDGTKTVYVKYKDAAGNWSNPISDTIILDTTAPNITNVTPPDGSLFEIGGIVSFIVEATEGAAFYKIDINGETVKGWGAEPTYSWNTSSQSSGKRTVIVYVKDAAGNEASQTLEIYLAKETIGLPALP